MILNMLHGQGYLPASRGIDKPSVGYNPNTLFTSHRIGTTMEHLDSDPLWHKDAIIYELHVRAFFDSNGDRIGDFQGLVQKLDYLQDLDILLESQELSFRYPPETLHQIVGNIKEEWQ